MSGQTLLGIGMHLHYPPPAPLKLQPNGTIQIHYYYYYYYQAQSTIKRSHLSHGYPASYITPILTECILYPRHVLKNLVQSFLNQNLIQVLVQETFTTITTMADNNDDTDDT